jgi:peptide deformylase
MALRQIRMDDDPILRKKSREVEVVDDRIREILDDMVETMYAGNGVGLSAVQIGVLKRLVVIDTEYDGRPPIKLVNPVIVKQKGEQECDEGCLSFPNQFAKVVRPMEVTVEALDENGKKIKIKGKELLAQCLAHELDHLDGVLFIDRMEPGTMQYIDPNDPENN